MYQLNYEIAALRTELNIIQESSPQAAEKKGTEINEKLHKRWTMVSGEAAVFVGLLLLGIYQIRHTMNKEHELASRQKNFLLSVTHELKSPIASTKLQLQTLQKHDLPREKQQEILGNAINDANRLNNLVENILLAARIENRFELHKEEYDISEYIREGMQQTIDSFKYKQQIKLDIQPGIRMKIDRTNFPSIILNLIENAVKYSPADTTITLSLRKEKDRILLSVADQGSGVAEADKQNIFEKFFRAGNEETRKTKGTGLGLYITKYLVEEHNGEITVKNNSPKGSIFEIRFLQNKV
jgi:signal transduction histidine kinase